MSSKITLAQFQNIFGALRAGGIDADTAVKLDMPDEMLGAILAVQDKQTYIDAYGVNIPTPTEITQGSVTLKKSIGGNTLKAKTALGQGNITAGNSGAFEYITAYLTSPVIMTDGFAEADLQQGFANAMAIKFKEAIDDIEEFREVGAHFALANLNVGVGVANIDAARDGTATLEQLAQVKGAIIAEAIALKNKYDVTKGIRRVPMQDIFIDIDETLFNNLYDARLIQDKADIVWRGGAWTVGTMGGFKVRPNRYVIPTATAKTTITTVLGAAAGGEAGWKNRMKNFYKFKMTGTGAAAGTIDGQLADANGEPVYALIATPYTAKAYRRLVAMNAGNMDNLSNDKGYYVETKMTGAANGDFQGITPYYADLIVPIIKK